MISYMSFIARVVCLSAIGVLTACSNKSVDISSSIRSGNIVGSKVYTKTQDGTYEYEDGKTYIGSVNKKGRPDGYGVMTLSDGKKIKGIYKSGRLSESSFKEIIYTDGSSYSGQIISFSANGLGERVFKSGDVAKGNFEYDQMLSGSMQLNSGAYLEGSFKDFQLHGIGLSKAERQIERGTWIQGKPVQTKTYSSNNCKAGLYSDFENWFVIDGYCGTYEKTLNGKGAAMNASASVFIEGEFSNGRLLSGTYQTENGFQYNGAWVAGKKQGDFIVSRHGNKIYEGTYHNDKRHGEGVCEHNGAFENCIYDSGKRIDRLHLARLEYKKQQLQIKKQKNDIERQKRELQQQQYTSEPHMDTMEVFAIGMLEAVNEISRVNQDTLQQDRTSRLVAMNHNQAIKKQRLLDQQREQQLKQQALERKLEALDRRQNEAASNSSKLTRYSEPSSKQAQQRAAYNTGKSSIQSGRTQIEAEESVRLEKIKQVKENASKSKVPNGTTTLCYHSNYDGKNIGTYRMGCVAQIKSQDNGFLLCEKRFGDGFLPSGSYSSNRSYASGSEFVGNAPVLCRKKCESWATSIPHGRGQCLTP